jgi:hypothetical protein
MKKGNYKPHQSSSKWPQYLAFMLSHKFYSLFEMK